ncbi:MAG: hypothetical protein H0W55_02910 [Actinobacteria bacterium]|nr:hypothetical protein [Actinomycetota bacterium]MDQ3530893.1 hypothetical protein [Actinomycetota bacterium]
MRSGSGGRIAWAMWGVTSALAAADVVLALVSRSTANVDSIGLPGQAAALGVAVGTVGVLVASRRTGNAIGWLFSALGLGLVLSVLFQDYAIRALVLSPNSLPAGELSAWFGSWLPAAGGVAIFLMLLFPDGHLPSRRWRPLAWVTAAAVTMFTVAAAGMTAPPGPEDLLGFNGPRGSESGPWAVAVRVSFLGSVVVALASVSSLTMRLRRARGHEREQLKWFVYAGSLLVLVVVIFQLGVVPAALYRWTNALTLFVFAGIPTAAGVAILKHHLYDIDLIINRTVVYSTLSITLGLVYYAVVVLLQQLVGDRFASSQVVVAGSTLAVAAMFRPARTRIQAVVDRRFNRRKYDAEETLDFFSARLRDEVDLNTLTRLLLHVVRQTLEPTEVSLWLRTSERTPESTPGARV